MPGLRGTLGGGATVVLRLIAHVNPVGAVDLEAARDCEFCGEVEKPARGFSTHGGEAMCGSCTILWKAEQVHHDAQLRARRAKSMAELLPQHRESLRDTAHAAMYVSAEKSRAKRLCKCEPEALVECAKKYKLCPGAWLGDLSADEIEALTEEQTRRLVTSGGADVLLLPLATVKALSPEHARWLLDQYIERECKLDNPLLCGPACDHLVWVEPTETALMSLEDEDVDYYGGPSPIDWIFAAWDWCAQRLKT